MNENFERWWREEGQFYPPCDRMTGESLELFKTFARRMHKECMKELKELEKAYEKELDEIASQ